jgi:signal transduction histidine kinase
MPFSEVTRTRQANMFMLAPLVIYPFFMTIGVMYGHRLLFFLGIVAIIGNLTGLWLSYKRRVTAARQVPLVINSLLILVVSNLYDFGRSLPYFFFPILVAYAGYYHFRSEYSSMLKGLLVTLLCLLLSIAVPPYILARYDTSPSVVTAVSIAVMVSSFALFFIFIKVLVDNNFKNERAYKDLLDQSARNAVALEEARNKAEAGAKAKGQFLSSMSHELRTPLNGIIGTTNLLLQDEVLPQQQQHFEVLKYSSEHMLSLVNDVLDFSKIDAGKMELEGRKFNLKECVEKTGAFFRSQIDAKGLSLTLHVDEQLDRFFNSDEMRLGQILHNLLSNAVKFTSRGGVQVQVSAQGTSAQGMHVRFSVADTGIGIQQDKLRLIFEGFEQVNNGTSRLYGGTGLGLSISKALVELFGSDLQVESALGKGSTFFFTLLLQPASQQQTVYVEMSQSAPLPDLNGLRVLLGEDNPVNRRVAEVFLHKWGASVTSAVNGVEMLEALDRGETFDVMLIDLEMPQMDGYEAIAAIREKGFSTKAIAFTAAVYDNLHQQLLDKGFDDYLPKPFKPEDLYKKLAGR